jgi:hypothetical protein
MRWAAIAAIALSSVSTSVLAQSPVDLRNAAFAKEGDALSLAPSLGRPGDAAGFPIRQWTALSFETDGLAFDVEPHAGFAASGSQAQAGATVSLHPRTDKAVQRLKDMGVREGTAFGDTGRWYLFAAASGRAVGMNVLKNEDGWGRAGWSTDPTGALVGDAQVGVGWRKGDIQSSFGVIYREVRGNHMIFGQMTRDDTVAAFSFSVRPQR